MIYTDVKLMDSLSTLLFLGLNTKSAFFKLSVICQHSANKPYNHDSYSVNSFKTHLIKWSVLFDPDLSNCFWTSFCNTTRTRRKSSNWVKFFTRENFLRVECMVGEHWGKNQPYWFYKGLVIFVLILQCGIQSDS